MPSAPINASQAFEVPDGVEAAQAVALGIAGMAAWLPLTRHGDVAGKRVLVLGASGVAGQIAVQSAELLGAAHVVAAGRHRETLEPLTDRGADAIAVMEDDPTRALAAAAGKGYDVVLDFVFGKPFEAAFGSLAPIATVVVIGLAAGMEATVSFVGLQGRTVIGHGNTSLPLEQRREAFTTMAEHVRDGRLIIEVETFPLDRATEAWTAQQGSPHRKLVVVP